MSIEDNVKAELYKLLDNHLFKTKVVPNEKRLKKAVSALVELIAERERAVWEKMERIKVCSILKNEKLICLDSKNYETECSYETCPLLAEKEVNNDG